MMISTEGTPVFPSTTKKMVTYRMADGSSVYGEYAFVTDTEWFTEGDDFEPIEVVREEWLLMQTTPVTFHPETCLSCEKAWHGTDCTEEPE